ncbi:unnamed protein product [Lactuca virosa]|uniref:Uncharacterized protein n=1 Tax=Lactuca virosa TaxID=75947 RepID=A0AAU9PDS0_9ASTR|nr:unnamed protein product [Lactuca virosa]
MLSKLLLLVNLTESLERQLSNVEDDVADIKCIVSMVDSTEEVADSPFGYPHDDHQLSPPPRASNNPHTPFQPPFPSNHPSLIPSPPLDTPLVSPQHIDDAKKE